MDGRYIRRRDNLSLSRVATGPTDGWMMIWETEISRPGQGQGDRHDAICMGGGFVIREHVVLSVYFTFISSCVHIMGR